jgi:5-methylcytosine-specific restriction endonuclease McrA
MNHTKEELAERNRLANRKWFAKKTEEERKAFFNTRYWNNKERYNAQSRAWAKKNPHKSQAATHQNTVKRKYPTAFEAGDITTPELASWLLANRHTACVYCGEPGTHIDHVIPLAKKGTHTWDNIVLACKSCNLSKLDRTPEEWKADMVRVLNYKCILDYKGT